MPENGAASSVAINDFNLHYGWVKFLNCTFADGLRTDHVARTTILLNSNSNLTFTPLTSSGETVSVEYVDRRQANASLSVAVDGRAVTVFLAAGSNRYPTSTAGDVKAALDANGAVSGLMTVALAAGEDGSGVVTAMPRVQLSYPYAEIEVIANNAAFVGCRSGRIAIRIPTTSLHERRCGNLVFAACYIASEFSGGNMLSWTVNTTDQKVGPVYVHRCHFYGGYKVDACIRPVRWDKVVVDKTLIDLTIAPVGVTGVTHVDAIQTIGGGNLMRIMNNRLLRQEGQGFFLADGTAHETEIYNNLVQVYPPHDQLAELAQLSSHRNLYFANNTFAPDVNGLGGNMTFNDGNGQNRHAVFFNNIVRRVSVSGGDGVSTFAANGYNWANDFSTGYTAGPGDVETYPTFVDTSNLDSNMNDYRLAGGNGVDDGTAVLGNRSSPGSDISGVTRSDPPNVGAYE